MKCFFFKLSAIALVVECNIVFQLIYVFVAYCLFIHCSACWAMVPMRF